MKKTVANEFITQRPKFRWSRVFVSFGILLLLLIPSYLAAATYSAKKNAPVIDIHTTYEAMSMVGPGGHTQNASAEENPLLFSYFTKLCQDGDKMVAIPPRFLDARYAVTLSSKDTTDNYEFYFFREENTCYYTNPDGEIFRSNHTVIPEFLSGTYAFEMYPASALPVLTTAATDEVIPCSVSWHYRTANGTFVERTRNNVAFDLRTYPIANDVAFYFSLLPSSHEILIHREGTLLYSGTSEGISLPLQDDDILDFEIRATYSPSSEQNYYGEIVYRFKMQVVEAAHFIPDQTQLYAGGVLLLRCENVKNVEKLVVTATPALEHTPVTFRRNDYVYVAIPVSETGTKRLQLSYGTVTDAFDFTVLPHPGSVCTLSADALHGDWSALLSVRLPTLIAQKGADTDSGLTPRTIAAIPYEKIFGYGDTLSVPDTALTNSALPFHLYRNSGTVRALAAGRVCFVGNDALLGNFVIVDHGCGLYTWYAGLAEARVVVGNILAVGETLGLSSTALYHEESVLIMATLGKTAISLEQLCDTPSMLPE